MALPTTTVNNAVNEIVNTYTGQSIAFQGGYQGQCTCPVDYYVLALTGAQPPYMADDSAQGWGLSFPAELAPYFTHEAYSAGTAYPKGTILMWNSPHIAIVLSPPTGNTVEVFEQNADPDGSVCHTATRTINEASHTCTYALVPIIENTPPVPAPAVSTPPAAPVSAPDVTTQYKIVYPVSGYTTATLAVSKPASSITVPVGSYYIYNQKYGMINVTATPGVPGNWINPSQNVIPVAATVPTPAPVTYEVIKTLTGYQTSNDAANHLPGNTDIIPTGSYYIFNQASGMINVTSKVGVAGSWINPADNIITTPATPSPVAVQNAISDTVATISTPVPVNPTQWKASYVALKPSPQKYVIMKNYTIKEYGGNGHAVPATIGQEIGIYGTFTYTDNVTYGRPKLGSDPTLTLFYGIPMTEGIIELESEVYSPTTTTAERQVTGTTTPNDKVVVFFATVKRILDTLTLHKL